MTLLQTRVDDRTASQFKQVAAKRDMSAYQLLNELVKQMAGTSANGWEAHRAWMLARKRTPLVKNAVLQTREGENR